MRDPMGIPKDLVEHNRLEHYLIIISKAFAVSGGVLFIALIAMSLVSIVGRKLGFGSVNGDIELMQAGTAVAACAFLPFCTLQGEHIKVDFFTSGVRDSVRRCMDGVAELLLTLVSLILTWRTSIAVFDSIESGETTALVSLPIWIPTALLVPSLALMAIAASYRTWQFLLSPSRVVGAP